MFAAARWLVVFALMVSIGLHTVVIQTTAWVSMLVQYTAQTGSIVQAVSDTFDGEHGCPLCKLAKQAQQSKGNDKQAPEATAKVKIHLIAEVVPAIIICALSPTVYSVHTEARCFVLPHSPATPPPRLLVA